MPRTAAEFIWYVFRTKSPPARLGDIECAKQALRRCLQNPDGLGWLIWDQATGWIAPDGADLWACMLARDFRRLIKARPPWLVPTTAERRRVASKRENKAARAVIDQARVAMFHSRIKQWAARCYNAPLSGPQWKAVLHRASVDKAARYAIMQNAVRARLIQEITQDMQDALKRQELPSDIRKEHRERRERLQQRRERQEQHARDAAWNRQRQLMLARQQGYLKIAVAGERLGMALRQYKPDSVEVEQLQQELIAAVNEKQKHA